MAGHHQGHRGGRVRTGYAPLGHPPGQGPHGDVYRGLGAANPVLCGAKRAGEHPGTAGAGHRGGAGAGGEVRQTGDFPAGGLREHCPPMGAEGAVLGAGAENDRLYGVHLFPATAGVSAGEGGKAPV